MAEIKKDNDKNGAVEDNVSTVKISEGPLAYVKGVNQELKKVVWLNRSELARDTLVVFIVCAFFAVAFWLIDTGFLAALRKLLGVTLS